MTVDTRYALSFTSGALLMREALIAALANYPKFGAALKKIPGLEAAE